MSEINRSEIENSVINLFLTVLRNNLSDPISPKRNNSKWIRSQIENRATPEANSGRKKYIIKNAYKVGYPQVIVGEFDEDNIPATIMNGTSANYFTNCTLKIFLEDSGHAPNVLGNLHGQISNILYTEQNNSLKAGGITRLKWQIVSTFPYSNDTGDYNEKQILLNFRVMLSDWNE